MFDLTKIFTTLADKVIDLFPKGADPAKMAQIRAMIIDSNNHKEIELLTQKMVVMEIEARDGSLFVKGARPAFLWFFVVLLSTLVVFLPLVGGFAYTHEYVGTAYGWVETGFRAIPEFWINAFVNGFLGYGAFRTTDKAIKHFKKDK